MQGKSSRPASRKCMAPESLGSATGRWSSLGAAEIWMPCRDSVFCCQHAAVCCQKALGKLRCAVEREHGYPNQVPSADFCYHNYHPPGLYPCTILKEQALSNQESFIKQGNCGSHVSWARGTFEAGISKDHTDSCIYCHSFRHRCHECFHHPGSAPGNPGM